MKSFIAPVLAIASTASAAAVGTYKETPMFMKRQSGTCPQGQLELQINSEVDTWYYAFDGRVWGSGSGQGGDIGVFCVPANANAGGAIYIGPDANPGSGSTKLECYFDDSGNGNCDVSLVDGYSLSMTCTELNGGSGPTIGGGVALYSQGNTCPDQQGPNCINDKGYGPEADVDAFFQPAIQNGNAYCIFVNCSQDYPYSPANGFGCTIDPSS